MAFRIREGAKVALAAAIAITAIPAEAQIFLGRVDFKPGPIEPSDPLIGTPIAGATVAEERANLLWNLRAGLNVAALQCQFSPYLRVVANYNAMLAHHAKELSSAIKLLDGYFKRVDGPTKGPKMFDDYSTIIYNGFSTLQAQLGFCQTASNIMKSALLAPKGSLIEVALRRMRELRNSLSPAGDPIFAYDRSLVGTADVPPLGAECWDVTDRLKATCLPAVADAVAAPVIVQQERAAR